MVLGSSNVEVIDDSNKSHIEVRFEGTERWKSNKKDIDNPLEKNLVMSGSN